jgi:uncharacterized protein YukE
MLENKVKSGRYYQSLGGSASMGNLSCHSHECQAKAPPKALTEVSSIISDCGSDMNKELIETLKARIESQQRRIVCMELEGKGSNAYASEMEKLHEQLSSLQARNLRLESFNIQLQLESEMLRKSDGAERQEARIKHLER